MKDATSALRKAYLTLLQPLGVPVYADEVNDSVAPYSRITPPKTYVILNNQTFIDQKIKQKFQGQYTIQVSVWDTYPAYNGSSLVTEQITNQITQIIINNFSGKIPIDGFHCIHGRVDLSRQQDEKTKEANYYRKVTIFSHLIEEI